MGSDQSPVDGNGMGWKLLCMVMGWDGMANFQCWGGMEWETSGAGMGWYIARDKNGWDGDEIEWGSDKVRAVMVSAGMLGSVIDTIHVLPI